MWIKYHKPHFTEDMEVEKGEITFPRFQREWSISPGVKKTKQKAKQQQQQKTYPRPIFNQSVCSIPLPSSSCACSNHKAASGHTPLPSLQPAEGFRVTLVTVTFEERELFLDYVPIQKGSPALRDPLFLVSHYQWHQQQWKCVCVSVSVQYILLWVV